MIKKMRILLICMTLLTSFIISFQIEQVKAIDDPPIADFIYTPSTPKNSSVIKFSDLSNDSDGSIVSWWWSFGDHYYSDMQNPVHCYYTNGLFTVNLSVLDNDGNKAGIKKIIMIDNPPITPGSPDPYDGKTKVDVDYNLAWTGGDIDGDLENYYIYLDKINPPNQIISKNSNTTYDPGTLDYDSIYYWKIVAWDIHGVSSSGPVWTFSTKANNPPNTTTTLSGQTTCWINNIYDFSTKTTDPDGDDIFYMFNWGDGTFSNWLGPYSSNVVASASHIWAKKGMYHVMVKAKDIHGAESTWSNNRLVYVV
jgi:PKD repeat protein